MTYLPSQRIIARSLAILFCALILACGQKPEKAIDAALDNRVNGLKNKDINLYMSAISSDYNDGKNTYATLKETAERHFLLFEKIDFQVKERSLYLNPAKDEATVVQNYYLSFTLPSGTKGGKADERLVLRKQKDGWKIIGGL